MDRNTRYAGGPRRGSHGGARRHRGSDSRGGPRHSSSPGWIDQRPQAGATQRSYGSQSYEARPSSHSRTPLSLGDNGQTRPPQETPLPRLVPTPGPISSVGSACPGQESLGKHDQGVDKSQGGATQTGSGEVAKQPAQSTALQGLPPQSTEGLRQSSPGPAPDERPIPGLDLVKAASDTLPASDPSAEMSGSAQKGAMTPVRQEGPTGHEPPGQGTPKASTSKASPAGAGQLESYSPKEPYRSPPTQRLVEAPLGVASAEPPLGEPPQQEQAVSSPRRKELRYGKKPKRRLKLKRRTPSPQDTASDSDEPVTVQESGGGEMTRGTLAMIAGPRVGVLLEARDSLGIGLTRDRETAVGSGPRTQRVLPLDARPAEQSVGSRGVMPIPAGLRPVRHVRSTISWGKTTHMGFASSAWVSITTWPRARRAPTWPDLANSKELEYCLCGEA